MLNILLFLAGIVLLVVIMADFLQATLGAARPNFVSPRLAHLVARLYRHSLPDSPVVRRAAGPLIATVVALFWIIGTSLAWTLILQISERSVLMVSDDSPAGWVSDFAFAGHLLSTLGGGITKPGSPGWAALAAFIAVNGMVILTLGIAFILSVTQAVVAGRSMTALMETVDPIDAERVADTILPPLCELVSELNAVPYALFYSSVSPNRRLPQGMVRLGRMMRLSPTNFAAFRRIVDDLPEFDGHPGLSDEAWLDQLDAWSHRYELREREERIGPVV